VIKGKRVQADHVWSLVQDGFTIETIAELFDVDEVQARAVVEYGRLAKSNAGL
jgi:uncharacterized protein (DUF433 family)